MSTSAQTPANDDLYTTLEGGILVVVDKPSAGCALMDTLSRLDLICVDILDEKDMDESEPNVVEIRGKTCHGYSVTMAFYYIWSGASVYLNPRIRKDSYVPRSPEDQHYSWFVSMVPGLSDGSWFKELATPRMAYGLSNSGKKMREAMYEKDFFPNETYKASMPGTFWEACLNQLQEAGNGATITMLQVPAEKDVSVILKVGALTVSLESKNVYRKIPSGGFRLPAEACEVLEKTRDLCQYCQTVSIAFSPKMDAVVFSLHAQSDVMFNHVFSIVIPGITFA